MSDWNEKVEPVPPKYTREAYDAAGHAADLAREQAIQRGSGDIDADAVWTRTFGATLHESDPGAKARCYVYMTFWGIDGLAHFLKVGISKDPTFRVVGLSTGNPLDFLWGYAMPFPSRKAAMACEKEIHGHLQSRHRRGEWFSVDGLNEGTARHMALQQRRRSVCDSGLFEVTSK